MIAGEVVGLALGYGLAVLLEEIEEPSRSLWDVEGRRHATVGSYPTECTRFRLVG